VALRLGFAPNPRWPGNRASRTARSFPGFYIGRYDIRYRSDEELRAGKGFQIIELNGAASEATNIYDASNSLWSARYRSPGKRDVAGPQTHPGVQSACRARRRHRQSRIQSWLAYGYRLE